MMDLQKLKIYHLTINWLFRPTIYALDNGFRIFLQAMNQSIYNEIRCHGKFLIKIYKSQKLEWYLFATLLQ